MSRTLVLMCRTGDFTFAWEKKNDNTVLPNIQKMIEKGYRFFILRKSKKVPVTKVTQAEDTRKIIIPDATLQDLFTSGVMTIGGLLIGEQTGEIAKTAEQVAENDTIVTAPVAGG